MSTIERFDGSFAFLSNFYPSPITTPSWHPAPAVVAPTVEHAFQAAKTENFAEALAILRAPTPGAAKRMGRAVSRLRPGWDDGRVVLMVALLRIKFASDSELAGRLLATGHSHLIEGNTWNDTFWGVCNSRGENWLGRSLMLVRAELDVLPSFTNLPRLGDPGRTA